MHLDIVKQKMLAWYWLENVFFNNQKISRGLFRVDTSLLRKSLGHPWVTSVLSVVNGYNTSLLSAVYVFNISHFFLAISCYWVFPYSRSLGLQGCTSILLAVNGYNTSLLSAVYAFNISHSSDIHPCIKFILGVNIESFQYFTLFRHLHLLPRACRMQVHLLPGYA